LYRARNLVERSFNKIKQCRRRARTNANISKLPGSRRSESFQKGTSWTRVSIQLEKFANRQVFLPEQAPWLVDFENELFAFRNGRYDDQVDALIQALAYELKGEWNGATLEDLLFLLDMSGSRGRNR
jgi:predicted phage terminase large subunit-like protein